MFSRIDGLKEALPLAEYRRRRDIASISLCAMISIQNGGLDKDSEDQNNAWKKVLGRFLVREIHARLKIIATS